MAVNYGQTVELLVDDIDDELEVSVYQESTYRQSILTFRETFSGATPTVIGLSELAPRDALLRLALTNTYSGYTYRWQLKVDGVVILEVGCGVFNTSDCVAGDSRRGIVRQDDITLIINVPPSDDDADGDGYPDTEDAFPLDAEEYIDRDNDGIGDFADPDDDNDGYLDGDDLFPLDPNDWADIDDDGIGDNADLDADGDGVEAPDDAFPLDPSESADIDGDGKGDNADHDTDGDGYPDVVARGFHRRLSRFLRFHQDRLEMFRPI